jgi:hypothetical protein
MPNFLIDEDTGLLAAEFVLGTLDSEERANAQALLRSDHSFIAMVRIWERRFGELHLMVEPVEPDSKILERIRTKLGIPTPSEPAFSPAAGGPPAEESIAAPSPQGDGTAEVAPPNAAEPEPQPAEASGDGESPKLEEPSTTPGTPSAEAEPTPALDAVAAALAAIPAGEPSTVEAAAEPETGAAEKVAALAVPTTTLPGLPPQPPPALKPADQVQDQPQDRAPDRQRDDVIRSRGRWRAFGVFMTLLVLALGALLAAWRYVPDRLPSGLRPSELMMSLGIEPMHSQPPAPTPLPPPESQFDE